MSIEIKTPTLKAVGGKRVRYKMKGTTMYRYGTIIEIINRNIIFDNDSLHFSQISELELALT